MKPHKSIHYLVASSLSLCGCALEAGEPGQGDLEELVGTTVQELAPAFPTEVGLAPDAWYKAEAGYAGVKFSIPLGNSNLREAFVVQNTTNTMVNFTIDGRIRCKNTQNNTTDVSSTFVNGAGPGQSRSLVINCPANYYLQSRSAVFRSFWSGSADVPPTGSVYGVYAGAISLVGNSSTTKRLNVGYGELSTKIVANVASQTQFLNTSGGNRTFTLRAGVRCGLAETWSSWYTVTVNNGQTHTLNGPVCTSGIAAAAMAGYRLTQG
jgi:hypothetical protein